VTSIPAIRGVIRRRILVNYRVEPAQVDAIVPPPFKVRLVDGYAMAEVCLIRLERVRPAVVPGDALGLASDDVAYRVAVEWDDPDTHERRQGVYIPRRDTSSSLQRAFGGRFFPFGRDAIAGGCDSGVLTGQGTATASALGLAAIALAAAARQRARSSVAPWQPPPSAQHPQPGR
jgi:hypothetical protein